MLGDRKSGKKRQLPARPMALRLAYRLAATSLVILTGACVYCCGFPNLCLCFEPG